MVHASVEMDQALSDNIDIRNQICILVAPQGNGTLLGSSSFREQDMVKLCIRVGQEHPKGVPQHCSSPGIPVQYW